MRTKILMTAGDPLGIGPEITAKAAASRALAQLELTVIGDTAALKASGLRPGPRTRFIPIDAEGLDLKNRKPLAAAGSASFAALELSLKLLESGDFAALVTAPISKEAWKLAGIPFTGHTSFFRARTGREPLMGFTAGRIRTALATEHVPLKLLSYRMTSALISKKIRLFSEALKAFGIKEPRLALAALNPHAGDGGLLGREEITVLAPTIARLRRQGLDIKGPLPSDTAWKEHLRGLSDGLLCLYHDQALTPLKVLDGAERAVHWTWGLPFVRTSPVHGTAFDIAGKGKADPQGMIAAALFAAKAGGNFIRNRR